MLASFTSLSSTWAVLASSATSDATFVTSTRRAARPSSFATWSWRWAASRWASLVLLSRASSLDSTSFGSNLSKTAMRIATSSKSARSSFRWWSDSWALRSSRRSAAILSILSSTCGTMALSMRRPSLSRASSDSSGPPPVGLSGAAPPPPRGLPTSGPSSSAASAPWPRRRPAGRDLYSSRSLSSSACTSRSSSVFSCSICSKARASSRPISLCGRMHQAHFGSGSPAVAHGTAPSSSGV
mmetsp:Transcript_7180/g.20073  ORF Transcript_7180/g.20073 Transcript_7180/m.20073 type:complete len:241 (+) Transcript_7180:426-1148(+)